MEQGWSRARSGGSEPSGLGEQLTWGTSLQETRLREITYALPSPPSPPYLLISEDIEGP